MVFLDPPSDSVQLLQQSLPESYISGVPSPAADASGAASGGAAVFGEDDEVLAFVASLAGVMQCFSRGCLESRGSWRCDRGRSCSLSWMLAGTVLLVIDGTRGACRSLFFPVL